MTIITNKDDLPDNDIDATSFIYDGNYILIKDECITDVLKSMNATKINEDHFHVRCDNSCFIYYSEVFERYALDSAQSSYNYSYYALEGKFIAGNSIIYIY